MCLLAVVCRAVGACDIKKFGLKVHGHIFSLGTTRKNNLVVKFIERSLILSLTSTRVAVSCVSLLLFVVLLLPVPQKTIKERQQQVTQTKHTDNTLIL